MRRSEIARQGLEQRPEAPQHWSDAVAHILEVYRDEPDDRLMIEATNNIYGPGIRTGLTMGDLRRIGELVSWNFEEKGRVL